MSREVWNSSEAKDLSPVRSKCPFVVSLKFPAYKTNWSTILNSIGTIEFNISIGYFNGRSDIKNKLCNNYKTSNWQILKFN